MVITRTVEMHAQLVGYDFKKKGLPTDKNIAVENSKVSNDYFWKTNKYTDQDVFGRTLDLTALINKPDGYLKGSLSDTEDVDYYEFNITEYRALSFAKDTYNKDITITLDHIPEGCDYEMVLYDEEGNQVGIGKENGNGGLSITIPKSFAKSLPFPSNSNATPSNTLSTCCAKTNTPLYSSNAMLFTTFPFFIR